MKKNHLGIGQFETLITVTLISIIAVVAVPFYKNQQVRLKISNGIMVAENVMEEITKYYYIQGKWPLDNQEAGLSSSESYQSEYIKGILVRGYIDKSTVTITYDIPSLGDKNSIVFSPPPTSAFRLHKWKCIDSNIVEKYLPKACRA